MHGIPAHYVGTRLIWRISANEYVSKYGTTWASVLVKTGVWDGKTKLMDKPSVVVETVKEAVEYGVGHEDYQAHVLDQARFATDLPSPMI